MCKKIFVDANIILDIFDSQRPSYLSSLKAYHYILESRWILLSSCDIITTIYYVDSKKNQRKTIEKIEDINKILKVIDFSNKEIAQTCKLMKEDRSYKDLEDTLQYILAQKENCDIIISNDKKFMSKDIDLLTSNEFVEKYIVKSDLKPETKRQYRSS